MNHKHIIKVAPLVRLPITGTQVFSYLHEESLPAGTLVSVPFYRRTLKGIVVSSGKDFPRKGGIHLKNIASVVEKEFLPERQIELAEKLARRYLAPLGIFLKMMAPEIKAKGKRQKAKVWKKIKLKKIPAKTGADSIFESKRNKALVIGAARERFGLDIALISGIIKQKKQCLIIVPEVFMSFEAVKAFRQYFPEKDTALVHGKILKKEFYALWKRIKEGRIKIVVATKLGVFLPFSDLGLVIVEEEGDVLHKQRDMSPRYNAARAAEILADLHGAKIVLGSTWPSVDTFWRSEKEKWQTLNLEKKEEDKAEAEIVDLFPERKKQDFPVSKALYENIARILNKKGKALLLAKRRGYSTFSVCRSCKNVLKCPKCDRSLVYFEELSSFRCLHCSFRADLFSSCPKCGGFQFSHLGVGTQLVERKIKRLFPRALIVRFDADSVKNVGEYEEFSRKIKNGKIDVIIGTQMALKLGGFFDFDLVGVISAQDFAGMADFNSNELAVNGFNQAGDLVGKDGKIVIQTFAPRDEIFNYLEPNNYGDFFEKEIKLRKKLFYPPFSRLIKLTFRTGEKKKLKKEAKRIFDLLESSGNNGKEAGFAEPYDPLVAKKRSSFYKNILIKIAADKELNELPLYPILGALKKGWTIDADPIGTT